MSRRSEHAGAVVVCGVLLGTLELLSIAAASRWPAVDDPPAQWGRAGADAVAIAIETPVRAEDDIDGGETQASLLFGQQVLARVGDAFDAARMDVAYQARFGARSPSDRFCPRPGGCD